MIKGMKTKTTLIMTNLIAASLLLAGCTPKESSVSETLPVATSASETTSETTSEVPLETPPASEEIAVVYSGTITVPSYLIGNETDLFAVTEAQEAFTTYELTEEQQAEAAALVRAQLKDSIDQVLADTTYYPNITDITYDEGCTVFQVFFSGTELNVYETTLRMSLYMAGDKLQLYQKGSSSELLTVVNYIDQTTGEIFSTGDSNDLHSSDS